MKVAEGPIRNIFKVAIGYLMCPKKIKRIKYAEAMERFGSDKARHPLRLGAYKSYKVS